MERGNFSAAAGFGFDKDKFGVFSTFGAFLEMVISEITMARLNFCNVLCHFSHSGGKHVCRQMCTHTLRYEFPHSRRGSLKLAYRCSRRLINPETDGR